MFTGLIETTGIIEKIVPQAQSTSLTIMAHAPAFATNAGDSICVSGVCLTVEECNKNRFTVTAVAETLERSTFARARSGDWVNLERALPLQGRLEGHFVLGHIDGTGTIKSDHRRGESLERDIQVPQTLCKYFAEKGSLAIDGISLTIARVEGNLITVALVPHTLTHTTMTHKKSGDAVNLEGDVIARYLEGLLKHRAGPHSSDTTFTAALENFLA